MKKGPFVIISDNNKHVVNSLKKKVRVDNAILFRKWGEVNFKTSTHLKLVLMTG